MNNSNKIKKYILKSIILAAITIIAICVWSFFVEPQLMIVKHYKIKDEKLCGLRIVFASDFHLKMNDDKKLDRIIKKINSQNADIVLLGGDFVNGHNFESTLPINTIARKLSLIKAKNKTISILGNHDWWLNGELIKTELEKNGIEVLLNENIKLKYNNSNLFIAGLEDYMTREPDIKKALQKTESPLILLTHSPDIFPSIPNNVTLTLAGHTHGGQVIIPFLGPLIVPSDYDKKYAVGYIEENTKKMIVSKGIGTSIIPIRFNCLPEIVVVDFCR